MEPQVTSYRSNRSQAAGATGHRLKELQVIMLKELQVIGCRSYRSQAEVATGHRLQELQVIG
jgi:hypothetical protein